MIFSSSSLPPCFSKNGFVLSPTLEIHRTRSDGNLAQSVTVETYKVITYSQASSSLRNELTPVHQSALRLRKHSGGGTYCRILTLTLLCQ